MRSSGSSIDHARLDLLRDDVFEHLGFVRIFADAAQLQFNGQDDAGAAHAIRIAAMHFKAAIAGASDIAQIRAARKEGLRSGASRA